MLKTLKKEKNILWAEIIRQYILFKRYFVNFISDQIAMIILFSGIFFGASSLGFSNQEISIKIIGIMTSFLGIAGIQYMYNMVKEENELGTMKQLFLLPTKFLNIFFVRFIVNNLFFLVKLIMITILYFFITGLALNLSWLQVAFISFLIIIGMLGFGFVFGGASFIFKRVDRLQNLFALILFPVSLVDFTQNVIFRGVANYIPYTLGLKIVQKVIKEDWSWIKIFSSQDFHLLLIITIIYFFLGFIIYKWFEKQAKIYGTLGKY